MISIETINKISFITIENNRHLKIVLSTLGASVFAIYFNNELMTLSLEDKNDYTNPELYHGKTIGPVCGRIANGQIDEFHYQMNENNVTRHGGNNGLSTQVFDYHLEEKEDTMSAIFAHDCFIVEYLVSLNDDEFSIIYHYQGKPQPISLTNHAFFHLGGGFNELKLTMDNDYFVENDAKTLIPLSKKEIIPCFNFKNGQTIEKDINDEYLMNGQARGYDHYLHFSKEKELCLSNAKYALSMVTDFDGVLIYSDNYVFYEKTIDHRIGIRKALAVEPQDSPLERKKYDDSHPYHRTIRYIFRKN